MEIQKNKTSVKKKIDGLETAYQLSEKEIGLLCIMRYDYKDEKSEIQKAYLLGTVGYFISFGQKQGEKEKGCKVRFVLSGINISLDQSS